MVDEAEELERQEDGWPVPAITREQWQVPVAVITPCDKSCNSRAHGGLEEQQGRSENLLNVSGKCLQGAVVGAET